MPKVSVIVAVYNAQSSIIKAIESIACQAFTDWECIICDDCSVDETLAKIKEFIKDDPRFIFLSNGENLGIAQTLNRCINIAQGEYIAIQDADDFSEPNRLEEQVDYLDKYKDVSVVGSYAWLFDKNLKRWGQLKPHQQPNKFDWLKGFFVIHASALMRRAAIIDAGRYDAKFIRVQDYDLWLNLIHKNYKVVTIPKFLYNVKWDISDYSRRTLKYRLIEAKILLKGLGVLKYSPVHYFYIIKTMLSGIIPARILHLYYYYRFGALSEKIKNLIVKLLLFFISCVFSLIAAEFLLRLIFPVYDPSGILKYKYYNSDGVVLGVKNFSGRQWINSGDYNTVVKINRYGFRDSKDISSSSYGDVFVLGDSFSFGHGVDESKRYSNLLQALSGKPVFNISTPGNLLHYEKLIKYAQDKGAKIKSLIVGVCMENDLFDYSVISPSYQEYRSNTSNSFFANFKEWFKLNSAIYNIVTSVIRQNQALLRAAKKLGFMLDTYSIINNPYSEDVLRATVKELKIIAKPFDTLLVLIPSRGLWVGNRRQEEALSHKEFVRLLKEAGLNVLDLRADFEATGEPMKLYFKNDAHWNELGHRLAAKAIVKHLK